MLYPFQNTAVFTILRPSAILNQTKDYGIAGLHWKNL